MKRYSAVLLLAVTSMYGQTGLNCDAQIDDGAHVFGSNLEKVQGAAGQLVNQGAEVRIRTVETLTEPTLERMERSLVKSCGSWQALDGGQKNNLVVLMVATKSRKSGIYYGRQWA